MRFTWLRFRRKRKACQPKNARQLSNPFHCVQSLVRCLYAGKAAARPSTKFLPVLLLVLGCLLLFGGLQYILSSRKQMPVTGWARVIDGDSLMVWQAAWVCMPVQWQHCMHRQALSMRPGGQRQRQAAGHRRAGEGAVAARTLLAGPTAAVRTWQAACIHWIAPSCSVSACCHAAPFVYLLPRGSPDAAAVRAVPPNTIVQSLWAATSSHILLCR